MAGTTPAPIHVNYFDGIRVIAAVVIHFSHIGAIDDQVAKTFMNWWNSVPPPELEDEGGEFAPTTLGGSFFSRGLLSTAGGGPPPKFITGVLVHAFVTITGYVTVLSLLRAAQKKSNLDLARGGLVAEASKVLGSPLLKRILRLGIPLLPVHAMNLYFWYYELAYFNFRRIPNAETVAKAYSVGIRALWDSHLNGPIWILGVFVEAPFLVVMILCVTFPLVARARFTVYFFFWLYFVPTWDHLSYYGAVVGGIALADLSHSVDMAAARKTMARIALPLGLALLSAPILPFEWCHKYRGSHSLAGYGIVILGGYVPAVGNFLCMKPFRLLAPYTFTLYIWHHGIYVYIGKNWTQWAVDNDMRWILVPTALVLAWIITYVAHRVMEPITNSAIRKLEGWRKASFATNPALAFALADNVIVPTSTPGNSGSASAQPSGPYGEGGDDSVELLANAEPGVVDSSRDGEDPVRRRRLGIM